MEKSTLRYLLKQYMRGQDSEEEFDAFLEYIKSPESDDTLRTLVDEVMQELGIKPVIPEGMEAWIDSQSAKMRELIHTAAPPRRPATTLSRRRRARKVLVDALGLMVCMAMFLQIGLWVRNGLTYGTTLVSTADNSQMVNMCNQSINSYKNEIDSHSLASPAR